MFLGLTSLDAAKSLSTKIFALASGPGLYGSCIYSTIDSMWAEYIERVQLKLAEAFVGCDWHMLMVWSVGAMEMTAGKLTVSAVCYEAN